MKISEVFDNNQYDVNATIKIFAGGQWNDDGKEVGCISCGHTENCPNEILNSNITYMTVDVSKGHIIVECDADYQKVRMG